MHGPTVTAFAAPKLVECYWVLPGQLLAGEYPARAGNRNAAERIDELLEAGIDVFIDLTKPEELPPYLPLLRQRASMKQIQTAHRRFPIVDFSLPERATMLAALDSIDAALADGHHVYLHCRGGLGRTGMAVGCYLVRHGRTGRQALEQIKDYWLSRPGRRSMPISPETPDQAKFVMEWREP